MNNDFVHTTLGRTGLGVHRLDLSATYRPGKKALQTALDRGVNLFFGFGFDTQMTGLMREVLKTDRKRFILATGAYNYIVVYQDLTKTVEKRLRQFGADYIDLFLFLGVMKEKEFPPRAREELCRLRGDGKVKFVGMSCHDRKFAGRLAEEGVLDVLMIRYNAAHPGAEEDIFPYVSPYDPGILCYTATRWTYLLRRPRSWSAGGRIATAGMCYRFVLSNPHVHACLTAPRSNRELEENLRALDEGPLSSEEMEFMRSFGGVVHHTKKWFM